MKIINLFDSNKKIIELINSKKSFSIVRLGSLEIFLTYDYLTKNIINRRYLHPEFLTLYNAGIYTKNKDLEKMKLFCKYYNLAIKNADILASFKNLIVYHQNFFSTLYNLPKIHSRSIEPFFVMLENKIPWTHYLIDNKVLIINPFVESFQKQINNNFQIFKDKKVFLDNQKFVFYKTYQTIAGNHIHNDWFETFTIMCNDISKLDFDIALLGCGGYGLPLCDFIKKELNKSAIYVGGGLQLLFGVMGKRWEDLDLWKKIIKENNCKFIKPYGKELCKNLKNIEDG